MNLLDILYFVDQIFRRSLSFCRLSLHMILCVVFLLLSVQLLLFLLQHPLFLYHESLLLLECRSLLLNSSLHHLYILVRLGLLQLLFVLLLIFYMCVYILLGFPMLVSFCSDFRLYHLSRHLMLLFYQNLSYQLQELVLVVGTSFF